MKLLGYIISLLNFLKSWQTVSQDWHHFTFPAATHEVRVPVSPLPHQPSVLSVFFITAILPGVKQCLIAGFGLHFPNGWCCWAPFHVLISYLFIFSQKCLLKSISLLFVLELKEAQFHWEEPERRLGWINENSWVLEYCNGMHLLNFLWLLYWHVLPTKSDLCLWVPQTLKGIIICLFMEGIKLTLLWFLLSDFTLSHYCYWFNHCNVDHIFLIRSLFMATAHAGPHYPLPQLSSCSPSLSLQTCCLLMSGICSKAQPSSYTFPAQKLS